MFDRNQLMNPSTFQDSTGGSKFQEGHVKVVDCYYGVIKPDEFKPKEEGQKPRFEPRGPYTAHVFKVQRLNEEMTALENEDGEPLYEEIPLSLGGASLAKIHPAKAESPEDEMVEDAGVEPGSRGPTVKIVDDKFDGLDSRSSASVFYRSLAKANLKPQVLSRLWAPDFIGAIFHMKTVTTWPDKNGKEQVINTDSNGKATPYKIVDKVVKQPTGKLDKEEKKAADKTAAPPAGKPPKEKEAAVGNGGAAAPGGALTDEQAALKILKGMATDPKLSGQTFTKKAFNTAAGERVQSDPEIGNGRMVPVVRLMKGDEWLEAQAELLDFKVVVVDGKVESITF